MKQKVHTKCAKLVDEKKYQLFRCLTNCEKNVPSKGIHSLSKKSQKSVCQRILFYPVLNEKTFFILSLNYQTLKMKQNTQNARSVSFVH